MRKIFDILFRILGLIPVLTLSLLFGTYKALYMTVLYLRYGGEFMAYNKFDRSTIEDLYYHLKEIDKEIKDEN